MSTSRANENGSKSETPPSAKSETPCSQMLGSEARDRVAKEAARLLKSQEEFEKSRENT